MITRQKNLDEIKPYINNDKIKILTGIRRSGKSVFLNQIQDVLKSEYGVSNENIISLNFESYDNQKLAQNPDDFYQYLKNRVSKIKGKVYFFFDEIQIAKDWQKIVNSLRVDFDSDIYITGSNASILSGELATLLSGRYVKFDIYPFSFSEFKQYSNIENDAAALQQYLNFGGMPSADIDDLDPEKTIKELSDIYDSIILRDVSLRGGTIDQNKLRVISQILMDSVHSEINLTNLRNRLNNAGYNISSEKIRQYVDLFKQAYMFYEINEVDIRGSQRLRTDSKFYVNDVGIMNSQINPSLKRTNLGTRLENVVFIELLRKDFDVHFTKINGKEIDFVADKKGQRSYFQVTYTMPENSQREIDNLLNIRDNYPKTLLVGIDNGRLVYEKGIDVKLVSDWLLED
ncbi:MAG: ATP-binding protein [Lactobacillaceae bacterium]|jgi:predicted AAA+ superfamily ATPase|nr:ATP-binding protein [Lactobacillaceae bacterium]